MALVTHTWTFATFVGTFGSAGFFLVWILGFYTNSLVDEWIGYNELYGLAFKMMAEPSWWLTVLLVLVACVGPGVLLVAYRRHLVPRPFEIVQEIEMLEPEERERALTAFSRKLKEKTRVAQSFFQETRRKVRHNFMIFRDRFLAESGETAEAPEPTELERMNTHTHTLLITGSPPFGHQARRCVPGRGCVCRPTVAQSRHWTTHDC